MHAVRAHHDSSAQHAGADASARARRDAACAGGTHRMTGSGSLGGARTLLSILIEPDKTLAPGGLGGRHQRSGGEGRPSRRQRAGRGAEAA